LIVRGRVLFRLVPDYFMDTSLQLILISAIIIAAYLIEVAARKTRIPAVLFLITLGVIIGRVNQQMGLIQFDFLTIIPVIGTFGLILIVFEGALELDYQKQKNRVIRNAFLSSLLVLSFTVAGLTFLFTRISTSSIHSAFVNAIPFSIFSSAIAIPSVVQMSKATREFITYESTFSDILGIILFNYGVAYAAFNGKVLLNLGIELVIVMVLSLTTCLVLLYLLKIITHQVKFILIITVMTLMFALGKYFHLSSLVLVLLFGLFLKNLHLIKFSIFQRVFGYDQYERDFKFLHQITAEGVFLIKTFFFVIFGIVIELKDLIDLDNILISLMITAIIYFVRAPLIRVLTGHFLPETFLSPRGLISILLYLSIPDEYKLPGIGSGVVFIVVLTSSLMMLLGRRENQVSPGSEISNSPTDESLTIG
jgi:Kef-type K+ transport system membrane component KefB